MATLAKLKARVAVLGGSLEDSKIGESHECRIEAPSGHVWKGTDLHELVDTAYRPWKPDYADLLDRIKYGVESCPFGATCEWCHPSED